MAKLDSLKQLFGRFARRLVLVLWQYAWWFVLASCAIAFAFQNYATLIFIIVFAFVLSVTTKFVRWVINYHTGIKPIEPLRYHFTQWGIMFLAIAFVLSVVAMQSGINLLYVVAGLMVSMVVGSMVLGTVCTGNLALQWRIPDHVYAGQPFVVTVTLRNNKRWFATYGIKLVDNILCRSQTVTHEATVFYVPARSEISIEYDMTLPFRGVHRLHPLEITSKFPLGVLETVAEFRRTRDVVVLPKLGEITTPHSFRRRALELNILRHFLPQDRQIEFFGLRKYRPGDNPRYIHWRTSAHRNELYVKEFERQEGKNILLLLDAYVPKGKDTRARERREVLETAISYVATLAKLFWGTGSFYAFATFTPDRVSIPFDVGPGQYFRVLETLARLEPNDENTLVELLQGLDVSRFGRALVVAVSLGEIPEREVHNYLSPKTVLIDANSAEFKYGFKLY